MRAPVTPSSGADGAPGWSRPPGLKIVAVGIVIEVVLLVGAAGAVGLEAVRGASNSVAVSVFLVLFFLGLAWLLVGSCRALWAGRRGGRAPIVVWQIMQGLVGVSLLTAGVPWAVLGGLGLLLVAGAVLVAVMTRRVVEATSG
jgi:hypothetical protein